MKPGTIILALLLSIIPAAMAAKKGRSPIGYYMLSLVLSPLLATIIVACLHNANNDTEIVKSMEVYDEYVNPNKDDEKNCG